MNTSALPDRHQAQTQVFVFDLLQMSHALNHFFHQMPSEMSHFISHAVERNHCETWSPTLQCIKPPISLQTHLKARQ